MASDFFIGFQWWVALLLLGLWFYPLTQLLFSNLIDKGYISSKVVGALILSYLMLLAGTTHILPFSFISLLTILAVTAAIFLFFTRTITLTEILLLFKSNWKWVVIEEIFFLLVFALWAYIRGFAPDINGLEKFMDFGFINSIIRSTYFPPKDMWLTPFSINYYYFGHFITAVLTKLSLLPSSHTYNLMIATIAGLTFVQSFSLAINLYSKISKRISFSRFIVVGLLTAVIITFAGNLHTLYTFFKPYQNEYPVPLWQLTFSPESFPNSYWYPNATRFIHNTIHEFPIYSWTVSDLHGHVADIPFVLLTLTFIFSLFSRGPRKYNKAIDPQGSFFMRTYHALDRNPIRLSQLLISSLLLAVMYMTNAWDGLIYLLLILFIIAYFEFLITNNRKTNLITKISQILKRSGIPAAILIGGFLLLSLPFSIFFKPFVSGIGVLCAPNFLTHIGHIGPFLFEPDHCQKSPWWQLLILYGFFYFFVALFIPLLFKTKRVLSSDIFVIILIGLATMLIVIPEFIYAKDIYPAHYRANTMFKLVFQSFMILSLTSGYIISRVSAYLKSKQTLTSRVAYVFFFISTLLLLTLVLIFPYFSVTSYYGTLQNYKGLDGTAYLKTKYSSDYQGIQWLNKTISGQPVILEAQGDSYTDFARVSANTGLPTVLGWTVHEWLWRGTYDIPSPRIDQIKQMYEMTNPESAKKLLNKYRVNYIFVGELERKKYKVNEAELHKLGNIVFQKGKTKIFKIN